VSEAPNKTDSRVTALTEVKAGLVEYDPSIGEYFVNEGSDNKQIVRGARRRTFSELRTAGAIQLSSVSSYGLVKLTREGTDLADDWGID
jgi:hypothetical protein